MQLHIRENIEQYQLNAICWVKNIKDGRGNGARMRESERGEATGSLKILQGVHRLLCQLRHLLSLAYVDHIKYHFSQVITHTEDFVWHMICHDSGNLFISK